MGVEAIRTELRVSDDRRVHAGLRGAIEHVAGRHGLSMAEQREFANEVDHQCCKAIAARGDAAALCDVVIEEQEDQIEVSMGPLPRHLQNEGLSTAAYPKRAESRDPGDGRSSAILVRRFHKSATRS